MDISGYICSIRSYVQSLSIGGNLEKAPGPVALDILEIFIHNESLSTYQIYSKLKSTRSKMAYKNVHKTTQRLFDLKLIVRTKRRSYNNDHNAKYYKLSERGIYRLFVTRHQGILVNRLRFMSIEDPIIKIDKESIRHCDDCLLFKTFLSPLMDTKLLSMLSIALLLEVYEYLHQCCKTIESILQTVDQNNLVRVNLCSWNAVLRKQNTWERNQLLLSLRVKLKLEHVTKDECLHKTSIEIDKERDNELEISNPLFRVKLRLDRGKKKVIAMLLGSRVSHEYEIEERDSDVDIMQVVSQINYEIVNEFLKGKLLNSLVYRMVSILGEVTTDDQKSGLKELSKDKKFMDLVDDAYTKIKRGRSALLELSE